MFDINKITRLVAYGCSYTQGHELADADFIPGLTLDQINSEKILLGYAKFDNKYFGDGGKTNALSERIRAVENQRAWPAKIIKELNAPWAYLNRARAGASMQEIVFTLEHDLCNGVINDTDLIIVGITSPLRVLRFDQEGNAHSLICTDNDHRWASDKSRELFIREFVNDHWELYSWYQSINYIDMLSAKFNNQILQQYLHLNYSQHANSKKLKPEFLKITDNLKKCNSIIDHDLSFYNTTVKWDHTNTHGCGHPYECVHDSLAKQLSTIIKKKYL